MKSNRMFGILAVLLEKEKVTAKELAAYFEVSTRTIHRDLLDLASAGFPVASSQGVGGGISLLPEFRYNKTALNRDDRSLILAAIQSFASLDDSAKVKTLLAKLRLSQDDQMLLENDIIIDFTSWNHNSTIIEKIKTIRLAIAGRFLLEMEYYSGSGYRHRTAEPYKLIFKEENWYLLAYCRYKDAFRLFKLNRMTDLKATREHFVERKIMKSRLCEVILPMKAVASSKSEWTNLWNFWQLIFLIQKTSRGMGMICSLPFKRNEQNGSSALLPALAIRQRFCPQTLCGRR